MFSGVVAVLIGMVESGPSLTSSKELSSCSANNYFSLVRSMLAFIVLSSQVVIIHPVNSLGLGLVVGHQHLHTIHHVDVVVGHDGLLQ